MAENHVLNQTLNPSIPHVHPYSPRDELAQRLSWETGFLSVYADGDIYAVGGWSLDLALENGKWYRASVTAVIRGIDDPSHMILCIAAKHFLREVCREGDRLVLEQTFQYREDINDQQFLLLLRACSAGSVVFSHAEIIEVAPPPTRIARIATVKFPPASGLTMAEQRERAEKYLDLAGRLNPDLTLLTECSNFSGVAGSWEDKFVSCAEDVPQGSYCRMLSDLARSHNMYVVAGLTEKRGEHVFNTAAIFDRKGVYVGRYAKTHLIISEMLAGVSCGSEYPVFDLDFGRVAIHICYDEWFPEISRYYAKQGAELLLLPVAGGKPITWRTRALDNNIYFVSASNNPPSMIIDSSGAIIAETDGGIAYADLDLNMRCTNAYIDPTLSYGMPCNFPQMRNTIGWAP